MNVVRLRWLYAAEGAALGLLLPFLVPLLDDRGLDAAELGLVLGASGLISLLAYPLWGALADSGLGRRRTVALAAVLAALGGVWVIVAGSHPMALAMSVSLMLLGAVPWSPLSDAIALEVLGEASSSYGRLRAWASVGWVAAALAGGLVWMQAGPTPVLVAFSLAALTVAAMVVVPGRGKATLPERTRSGGAPGVEPGTIPGAPPDRAWRRYLPLLAAPVLLGFMLGLLLSSIGAHATWRFIGLRILDQGGGVFLVALAAALPAIVEVPVFASSRRLAGRLGLRMVFVWGAALAAVLTVLVAVAPEPWMVTALRTIDGATYALRYLGMVLIIGALLPRHLFAFGQSLAWFVYAGIAPIVADAAGGLIYGHLGAAALFITAAGLLVLGGAVVYIALAGPSFRRRAAAPAVPDAPPLPAPPP